MYPTHHDISRKSRNAGASKKHKSPGALAAQVAIYTVLQKKIPRIYFQYSVSFPPAEYEYVSHFFPSRPVLPKFYDEGLKINKIGCL